MNSLLRATRHFSKGFRAPGVALFQRASLSTATSDALDVSSLKPFSSIPNNWRGSLPVFGTMLLFSPYLQKGGGMRTEDFMRDQYENYAKETGLSRFGPPGSRGVLVFDDSYLNVLKSETKYPTGILEGAWPIQHYNRKYNNNIQNPFLAKGEAWRAGRMSINPYLFNIQQAQTYLGAITEAANSAASKFEDYASNGKLDKFCELAAFDMFMSASLGLQTRATLGDPKGLEYSEKLIGSLATMSHVTSQCPYSKIDSLKFKKWDEFVEKWSEGKKASEELIRNALELGEGSGKGIIHGFMNDENLKISKKEAGDTTLILLFAAADTTSSLINNVLTNLSKHPHVQDKVRNELKAELNGGDFHADANLKYLDQVLKETQRLTPPLPWVNVKVDIPKDLALNGYHIPKGTNVMFSHMGIANDEQLAGPNPTQFNPDRFSEAAIAARKGTRQEFLDHPLACKPFGFGARMCVGSRVAALEYKSLLSRIIQDYKLSLDIDNYNSKPTVRLSRPTTTEQPCPKFKVQNL